MIIREKEKKHPREESELEDMNKGMGSRRRRERVKSRTDVWKEAPHHSSGKRKSEPQRDVTSHLAQCLVSERQEMTSMGKVVEKREPLVYCWWESKLLQPL